MSRIKKDKKSKVEVGYLERPGKMIITRDHVGRQVPGKKVITRGFRDRDTMAS